MVQSMILGLIRDFQQGTILGLTRDHPPFIPEKYFGLVPGGPGLDISVNRTTWVSFVYTPFTLRE